MEAMRTEAQLQALRAEWPSQCDGNLVKKYTAQLEQTVVDAQQNLEVAVGYAEDDHADKWVIRAKKELGYAQEALDLWANRAK